MSSDPFDLLGLDRATATEADVRRAYAERLKVTRPEDDRAGFMALRAAFEHARESARWRDQHAEEDPYEDYEEDEDGADETEDALVPPGARSETAPESEGELAFAPEPETEPEYEPETIDADEQAFEVRVQRAIDRMVDLLTATGQAPDVNALKTLLDDNEVAGIDEFQALQWRVRQLLCDRTGYNLEPQQIRRPNWLSLDVFDTLDRFYGWTTQPTTHPYVRRLNDWMAKVRTELAWLAIPKEERKAAELNRLLGKGVPAGARPVRPAKGQSRWENESKKDGSMVWLWVGLGILGSQLVRFLFNTTGG